MKYFDDELERPSKKTGRKQDKRLQYLILMVVVLLFLVIGLLTIILSQKKKETEPISTEDVTQIVETMADADPQNETAGSMSAEKGTAVNMSEVLLAGETEELQDVVYGIDVAKYQGTIDWQQVAASGIDFAMVRVGYRTQKTGEICEDANARYNLQEATANGLMVGAYFFSSAVTREEAIEEADWVANLISQYQITYPVAYNCEGFTQTDSRQYSLTQSERTEFAMAFLNEIYSKGYTPMFYAAKNELESDAQWDTSRLEEIYKIWVAQYPAYTIEKPEYSGKYAMWQYTNQGTVAGIEELVDVNIAYFTYAQTADAKSDETPEMVTADVEALMNFTEVNETVTAKEKSNLRDIPSQEEESTVMATLINGETATRTGISDSGWSRVEYNGNVYYAVSNYLTTDLTYQASTGEGSGSGDGIKTKFSEANDQVTAKIEVNLRSLPSVTNPDASVVAVLHNGEVVTRTGINQEFGWSRIEYNGQTLYCISSYLTTAQ